MSLAVEISHAAEIDLENIFDYTLQSYGVDQAVKYTSSFDVEFKTLASNPEIGRKRIELRKFLRSFSINQHVIFYRIKTDKIRIVRVLYSSADFIDLL